MAKNVNNLNYNEDSIELLEGLEGVRKRPAMYIGSTNAIGLHHLVWEVVDNAVDEAMSGYGDLITVTIHKDGSISVQDEGRGIPTGLHKKTGVPAVQLIFSTLHSGGKFTESAYKTSAGLHGVGASVTNALSEWLDVTVFREGKIHHLRFENGGKLMQPMEILGNTNRHGTLVTFKPDAKVFSTVDFKWDTICNHLQESAFLLKKVHFLVKDERSSLETEFYYEDGLSEYIAIVNQNKTPMNGIISFEDTYEINGNKGIEPLQMEIAMQYCNDDYQETVLSYVNNVRTHDGGTHETGFRMGLTRAVNDFAFENSLLRGKEKLDGTDIREGLTAIISLRIPEEILEFEGQTKGKLGTSDAMAAVNTFIYNRLTYYLRENHEFAVNLVRKCIDAQNARKAARKAKEEARKTKKPKNDYILSGKLTPAQSKNYALNELFIVEGDSAGGTARSGRDRTYQAILPLRGKPLNTDTVTMEKMLKNEEFATLINTIGAGVGKDFEIEDIHYGKIIIMTDADTDGAHIQTLLLTFFYHYMKPLIQKGHVYIAVPPLYRVHKEVNKKIAYQYAWDNQSLEDAKKAIGANYRINRYKGLGEMNAEQLWETTMNPASRTLIRVGVEDPLLVEKRVSILMGKDAGIRRKWIEENVDFQTVDRFIDEVK
ncbi:MAG: DNA topoisomerase IV subunit B [Bacilli bacterium]|jgi:topoisomerase-4 subunit B|nr:DNA topoisomerase IV subunit B [Bacilli bacterium]MDD3388852.1 DNA topoisomerase IV subunit B [Bacilli bacterium]MDD4344997.1 DNA topoisomerase IV subunit B [Bacilli bacterium]MDD4520532.1 DNA topoisomerase IV subunit B [Bacilli bacterium]MDY0399224.1 DNA topoisomerase IV subunit B [Bacilli bacterium]